MRKILLAIAVMIVVHLPGVTSAQIAINAEMAPTGKLRMGLNASTTTLVTRTADGNFSGISVDLGKFIAEKLGMAYEPVVTRRPPLGQRASARTNGTSVSPAGMQL